MERTNGVPIGKSERDHDGFQVQGEAQSIEQILLFDKVNRDYGLFISGKRLWMFTWNLS